MIMTRFYHLFFGVVLLILTACAAADPSLEGDISPATSGIAVLSWDPTPGTDLAGYKVYLATASGVYGAPIATIGTDATSYTVTGLAPGTYFFVVTAFNTDGTESTFSNEASTVIL